MNPASGDLLRHVIGPTPYSAWWPWLAAGLTLMLALWYAGVFLATLPDRRLRELPLVGAARDKLVRRRFAKAVRAIGNRYRTGDLAAAGAGAAVSFAVRGFLREETGVRAEYLQLPDLAVGETAPAAALLEQLDDARFNPDSEVDVHAAIESAEELIRSWA